MKRGILVGIQRKMLNNIPGMIEIGRFADETKYLLHANPDLLHAPGNTHNNYCCRLEYSPWWLNSSDMPGNCLNWVTLVPSNLSLTVGLKICPVLICTNPRWAPLGGLHTS